MTTTDQTTFEAVYRNGVLEPLAPVAGLAEGQRVRVQVQRIAAAAPASNAAAEEPLSDAALAPWPAEDADEVARWAAYERRVAADLARHLASPAQDADERASWPSDPAGDAEWAAYERRVAADLARHLASPAEDADERAPWPSDPAGDAEWAAYEQEQAYIHQHGLSAEIIERRMKLLNERGRIFTLSETEVLEIAMDPALAEENQEL